MAHAAGIASPRMKRVLVQEGELLAALGRESSASAQQRLLLSRQRRSIEKSHKVRETREQELDSALTARGFETASGMSTARTWTASPASAGSQPAGSHTARSARTPAGTFNSPQQSSASPRQAKQLSVPVTRKSPRRDFGVDDGHQGSSESSATFHGSQSSAALGLFNGAVQDLWSELRDSCKNMFEVRFRGRSSGWDGN